VNGFFGIWVKSNLGILAHSLLFSLAFFAAALVISLFGFFIPPSFVVLLITTLGCVPLFGMYRPSYSMQQATIFFRE
jgi:hypothetical protein